MEYDADELTCIYLVYHLQVIGEAASRLSDEFCDTHPAVPWDKIVGMRNVLIHNYMEIQHDVVWDTLTTAIPALRLHIDLFVGE